MALKGRFKRFRTRMFGDVIFEMCMHFAGLFKFECAVMRSTCETTRLTSSMFSNFSLFSFHRKRVHARK